MLSLTRHRVRISSTISHRATVVWDRCENASRGGIRRRLVAACAGLVTRSYATTGPLTLGRCSPCRSSPSTTAPPVESGRRLLIPDRTWCRSQRSSWAGGTPVGSTVVRSDDETRGRKQVPRREDLPRRTRRMRERGPGTRCQESPSAMSMPSLSMVGESPFHERASRRAVVREMCASAEMTPCDAPIDAAFLRAMKPRVMTRCSPVPIGIALGAWSRASVPDPDRSACARASEGRMLPGASWCSWHLVEERSCGVINSLRRDHAIRTIARSGRSPAGSARGCLKWEVSRGPARCAVTALHGSRRYSRDGACTSDRDPR